MLGIDLLFDLQAKCNQPHKLYREFNLHKRDIEENKQNIIHLNLRNNR